MAQSGERSLLSDSLSLYRLLWKGNSSNSPVGARMSRYFTRTVPRALRCAYCTSTLFQAFSEDIYVIADNQCPDCLGKGVAPVPPVEVGL